MHFAGNDIVILAVPVYAGRVPNVLLNYLKSVKADGAKAIAMVLYGNRNYDDALLELTDILRMNGFNISAAGAFIGEHSFSKILAKDRPDESDLEKISEFAKQIYLKISLKTEEEPLIPGNKKYRDYYKPKDKRGDPVDIRKVTPKPITAVLIANSVFQFVLWAPLTTMMFQNLTIFALNAVHASKFAL